MTAKSDPNLSSKANSAWWEASDYGIDMSLLECNLRKTPWERMKTHDRALTLAQTLREAMRKRHA